MLIEEFTDIDKCFEQIFQYAKKIDGYVIAQDEKNSKLLIFNIGWMVIPINEKDDDDDISKYFFIKSKKLKRYYQNKFGTHQDNEVIKYFKQDLQNLKTKLEE